MYAFILAVKINEFALFPCVLYEWIVNDLCAPSCLQSCIYNIISVVLILLSSICETLE